jgi:hypothetical protein
MVELAVILLLLGVFLLFFKLLAVIFKAGMFVLTIPLQIVGALLAVLLVVVLLPFALVAGVLTAVLAPLFVLGPLLPLALVFFGLYLVMRR